MTKQAFLHELEQALLGRLPEQKIQENLRYYDSYIEEQKATGKTEEEVLEQLGDAGLIAQSILAASGADAGRSYSYSGGYGQDSAHGSFGKDGFERKKTSTGDWMTYIDLSKWYWKLAVCAVAIIVVALVLAIVFGILKLLFYIAVPVIAVVAVLALIEYFKEHR